MSSSNPVVSALHLLEGQTKSPVHAETARRARNEIEKLTRELELRKYASQQADARRAERDRLRAITDGCPVCSELVRNTVGAHETESVRSPSRRLPNPCTCDTPKPGESNRFYDICDKCGKGIQPANSEPACICRPAGAGDGDTYVVNPRCRAHK